MRMFLACFAWAAAFATPALADQTDKRLERLFNQLAAVRSGTEAAALEAQIESVWLKSGSDTIDVLMSRAEAAMAAQDIATAKKLLDAVVEMKPDYAEVWYRRAELLLQMDSQQEAEADLAKAIELEPRHYKALAIAGRLAEAAGNKAAALAAYSRATQLNPMMEAVARRALQLQEEQKAKPPPI